MSKFDSAKLISSGYLDEIVATIEIRQIYNSIIVAKAGDLMAAFQNDKTAKSIIQNGLRHKTVDPNVLYKSLIVQINGVFENYIRSLVEAIITDRFESVELYEHLEEAFRREHISHAAKVLTHIKERSIMGSPYNFDDLLANLGKSLSGKKGYKLNPEVFTKLMGNCTAERLEKLFSAILLQEPFSDSLGNNSDLRKFFNENSKRRVANNTKLKLDKEIDLRNSIVHGDLTLSVDLNKLQDTLEFFRALIAGLHESAQAAQT